MIHVYLWSSGIDLAKLFCPIGNRTDKRPGVLFLKVNCQEWDTIWHTQEAMQMDLGCSYQITSRIITYEINAIKFLIVMCVCVARLYLPAFAAMEQDQRHMELHLELTSKLMFETADTRTQLTQLLLHSTIYRLK